MRRPRQQSRTTLTITHEESCEEEPSRVEGQRWHGAQAAMALGASSDGTGRKQRRLLTPRRTLSSRRLRGLRHLQVA